MKRAAWVFPWVRITNRVLTHIYTLLQMETWLQSHQLWHFYTLHSECSNYCIYCLDFLLSCNSPVERNNISIIIKNGCKKKKIPSWYINSNKENLNKTKSIVTFIQVKAYVAALSPIFPHMSHCCVSRTVKWEMFLHTWNWDSFPVYHITDTFALFFFFNCSFHLMLFKWM